MSFKVHCTQDSDQNATKWTSDAWSISQEMFDYIRSVLDDGATLLELGSGWASGQLSKYYTVYSIEHDRRWLYKYNTNYIYAPIRNRWYDIEVLKKELPIHYDLILVDGPPGPIGRGKFYDYLDLFNTKVPIIFDDINEPTYKATRENFLSQPPFAARTQIFAGRPGGKATAIYHNVNTKTY